MTVSDARVVIKTLRRQLLLATVSRIGILGMLAFGLVTTLFSTEQAGYRDALWFSIMFAALTWVAMSMFSVRQLRAAHQASAYISNGRLDLAEEQLKSAVYAFSMYRSGKLLACHNLAVVAHGRKNYQASAELCHFLIAAGGSTTQKLGQLCRILLADCCLYLDDAAGALEVIQPLTIKDRTPPSSPLAVNRAALRKYRAELSLAEQVLLLPIQIRSQIRLGHYDQVTHELLWKVRVAEAMDSSRAALVHSLLAKACRVLNRSSEAAFLQKRAELYADMSELATEYPETRDSAATAIIADNNADIAPQAQSERPEGML